MTCACRLSRRAALTIAALVATCPLGGGSAAARISPEGSALSPELTELAKPSVRGLPPARQAKELGVAVEGPGSLVREGNRVLVEVRFDQGAIARLDALRATGARVAAASRRYQTVTASVAPGSLRQLASVGGVGSVSEVRAPILLNAAESSATAAVGAECEGGSVISEGVTQLHVAEARSKYDVDGSGVTVGVLSDSYDEATTAANGSDPIATKAIDDVESSDLPGPQNTCPGEQPPVNVLEDFGFEPADEGRAMAQIVHDVAPGASLAFATAFVGEASFAQNIERLAKPVAEEGAAADVIVDDIIYFNEPFFQDGPVAVAADKVTSEGVPYFSSAGNENLFDSEGREVASWEAQEYRDSGACPSAIVALSEELEEIEEENEFTPIGLRPTHCMDFNPAGTPSAEHPEPTDTTFGIKVSPGATLTLDLQWAEPWYGVGTDIDAFLIDSKDEVVGLSIDDNASVGGTQKPVELLQWENEESTSQTVRLVINRFSGVLPRLKFVLLQNGGGVTETEYPESSGGDIVGPTIFGHAGATGAVAVAAVPYNNSSKPESYSSRGPVTHYFGPVTGVEVPALPLLEPEAIAKPNITATDCGETTFFAFLSAGRWRFCGTSASAPHAAGVAALQLDSDPGASVEEVREAQESTAVAVGAFGPSAVGAGLLDADGAVASLSPPSSVEVTITGHPASRTNDNMPTFEFEGDPEPEEFTCAIDGQPSPADECEGSYTAPAPLSDTPPGGEKHKFEVDAINASTVVGTASFSFAVDTQAPAISFGPLPEATADTTPTFTFGAGESADFTCSLDGAAAKACKSPYTPSGPLADGPHTLTVDATDQAGNKGTAVAGLTVDTTPPTVTFSRQNGESTADAAPAFAFGTNEAATFSCSLDGAVAQPCSSPYTPPGPLADGSHTLAVNATDSVGNTGSAAISVSVDTVAPAVTLTGRPKAITNKNAPVVWFVASEPVAFTCSVDGQAARPCVSPYVSPTPLADGPHTFRVVGVDAVGHAGSATAAFVVDVGIPRTYFARRPPKVRRTRHRRARVAFRFGSNDSRAGFICRIDRGLFHFCRRRVQRRLKVGRHTVRVKAYDAAGNVDPTPAVYRFRIKRKRRR